MAFDYIQAALCHLESRNIKVNFSAEGKFMFEIKIFLFCFLLMVVTVLNVGTENESEAIIPVISLGLWWKIKLYETDGWKLEATQSLYKDVPKSTTGLFKFLLDPFCSLHSLERPIVLIYHHNSYYETLNILEVSLNFFFISWQWSFKVKVSKLSPMSWRKFKKKKKNFACISFSLHHNY